MAIELHGFHSAEALAQVTSCYWHELKRAAASWLEHEGPRLAASLSLYSLLSLAPLVPNSRSRASLVCITRADHRFGLPLRASVCPVVVLVLRFMLRALRLPFRAWRSDRAAETNVVGCR
jgi:hypothetical protein